MTQHGSVRDERIGKARACVTVRVERAKKPCRLRIQADRIHVLKPDALVAPLPEGAVVLHADGSVCEPTGRFYVTVESFDPVHLLVDLF